MTPFGRVPALYAADRGFYKPANVEASTAAGVGAECVPRRGGKKTEALTAHEKSRAFEQGQRFRAGIEIARELGLEIFVHDRNYGYGANQKTCCTEGPRAGCDVVVMVLLDSQYDPTLVPKISDPIVRGEADLVLGSRVKGGGSVIEQGMPWWKYTTSSRRRRDSGGGGAWFRV